MRIAVHGHMGRDASAVGNFERFGHEVNAIGVWENPNVIDVVRESGGQSDIVDKIGDVVGVADFVERVQPDLFFTHFDDALAAGVVDEIQRRVSLGRINAVLLASPDKDSSRIEWDKFLLRDLLEEINSDYNPDYDFKVTDEPKAADAIDFFEAEDIPYVLKPRYPTGGKGVWVKDKHFYTKEEALAYSMKIINDPKQGGLEVQERMDVDKEGNIIGHEYTLQYFTDGSVIVNVPATYDYPYRKDGDEGSGTGGMGVFTQEDGLLPFIDAEDQAEMDDLATELLQKMKDRGLDYKGNLYVTVMKQKSGRKRIIEVNARGGDGELINIIDSFEDDIDYGEVLRLIALGELATNSVRFKRLASAMVYAVSKGYANPDLQPTPNPNEDFDFDWEAVKQHDVHVRFAAARRIGNNRYQTTSISRIVGFSALDDTPWLARRKIDKGMAAAFGGTVPFDVRNDVANEEYIRKLAFTS